MENLEEILESSFLDYSAFVLQRRAIPDARDGLKYTARQILHAQYKDKLDANHPFKKSQKSVSAATAFSYVHGDTSAYEQIIRMGRPLVQRYALEEINGNGGTPTGSSTYSAQRYTEARLSNLGLAMFNYINDGVLDAKDWSPTYDEEGMFPLVLPSVGFYNLCNGSFGSIGVGLISSIPQFNLKEMNQAIVTLINNPKAEVSLLPDFASGGILMNPNTVLESLSKGEGKSALIRGKIRKNAKEGWLEVIELPYGVYTNTVCVELENALNKGNPPFTKFKDLTQKTVQLRIYGPDLDELEKWLYKNTSVQKYFTIKLILLDNGKTPKKFSLKQALLAHIDHAKKVYRAQYEHELSVLDSKLEILDGLIRAHSIIDEIVAMIKESSGRADSISKLISDYNFTKPQAEAIVDLRLHRLANIDVVDLNNQREANLARQNEIKKVLNDKTLFNQELSNIYLEVAEKYGDERKTEISAEEYNPSQQLNKAEQDFWMVIRPNGYLASYQKNSDNLSNTALNQRHLIELDREYIIITNYFRGFLRKGSDFVVEDTPWDAILRLEENEKVIFMMAKDDMTSFEYLECTDSSNKVHAVHSSYALVGASKSGRKLLAKKQNFSSIAAVSFTSASKLN